jgi:hypothetical protein
MQMRQNRQDHRHRTEARHARRLAARWLPFLLLAALAIVAVLAPAGQARSGSESAEAKAQAVSQKATEREERAAARKAQRETEKAAAKPSAPRSGSSQPVSISDGANSIQISCTAVVWEFRQFPAGKSNSVSEKITFIKKGSEPVSSRSTFTFEGASGTNTTTIDAPVGTYTIDAESRWAKSPESVGKNGFDLHTKVECPARAAMTLAKLQKLPGGTYTSSPISAEVGKTVDYQIVVDNTGNVPLALGSFTDPHCDEGTLSGGPAGGILAGGASTEYLCSHLLTAADLTVGKYENTVQLTGTPTEYLTTPITEVTNTVEAVVVAEGSIPTGGGGGGTAPTTGGATGTGTGGNTPTTTTPKSGTTEGKAGVLGFSAASVPALKGPQGCMRASFKASIKSAGVASVTFYLDAHKLKKLTSHNSRKGLLSIAINPSKLSVGAHHLVAKITMAVTKASPKAVKATRTLTLLRCRSNVVTPKFTG